MSPFSPRFRNGHVPSQVFSTSTFLDRDEIARLNVFDGRNADTVRFLSVDGEHVEYHVAEAKKFLTTLVKNCDRTTGLVTLEGDADSRDLSLWERFWIISETHMENYRLATDTGVYEGAPRELIDARFGKQTYEVWIEGATESLGRSNNLPFARKIAENSRKECLPAVVCLMRRWFVPATVTLS